MNNEPTRTSFIVLRIVAGLLALPPTALAIYFAPPIIISGKIQHIALGFDLSFATAAALFWWLAIRGHIAGSRAITLPALFGAFVLGGLSFVVVYFLYGISWSILAGGPLGFILGAFIGGAAGLIRKRVRYS